MSGQTITIISVITVTATITVLLRAFPFLLFSTGRKCPPVITYIGKVLSPAAIAMLVVYCLCSEYRGRSLADGGWGLPELIASVTVIALHRWKKNPLLSIITGTAVYMLLVQCIFS